MFYPGDWLRHPGLRSCSLAARGAWIDLMAFMHGSTRYGYLVGADGRALAEAQIARMIGVPAAKLRGLLAELLAAGVGQRAEDGTLYSPRMVEDERIRAARAAGGSLGGSPLLKSIGKDGSKVNLPPNHDRGEKDNRNPTPSVAVAVSASGSTTTTARDRLLDQRPQFAELLASEAKEHGDAVVERACVDLEANGELVATFCASKIRNFVAVAAKQATEHAALAAEPVRAPSSNGHPRGTGSAEADRAFDAALTFMRDNGGFMHLPPNWPTVLGEATRSGISAAGGFRTLAEANQEGLSRARRAFNGAFVATAAAAQRTVEQ